MPCSLALEHMLQQCITSKRVAGHVTPPHGHNPVRTSGEFWGKQRYSHSMAYLLVKRKEVRRVHGGCGARASPGRVGMGSWLSRYLVKRRERSKFPRSVHLFDKGLFRKQHLLPESPGCSLGAGLVSISASSRLIGKEAVHCQELVHKPNLNTIGLRVAIKPACGRQDPGDLQSYREASNPA